MIQAIMRFKSKHGNLYEFIMFNVFSNVATIINFLVLNISANFIFKTYANTEFSFWIFNYSKLNGGLGGFLSFLLSYACAQTVNFIVQRKLVFNANNRLAGAIPIYILTVLGVYLICLYIPTITIEPLTAMFSGFIAVNLTNVINILVQVIVLYPVLKFVVMTKEDTVSQ